jgi:hypothetical protein
MPPHCDSLDGPVVTAARQALEREDVAIILPYVNKRGEQSLSDAYDLAVKVRSLGPEAQELADRYFFETAVRIHRAGEGAPFTGLKRAGLDVGPVIPIVEKAIDAGSPERIIEFFIEEVQSEIATRFESMLESRSRSNEGIDEARDYVGKMLGLQVWSHKLYGALKSPTSHESHE